MAAPHREWALWIAKLKRDYAAYQGEFAPRVRGPYSDEVDAFLSDLVAAWGKHGRAHW